MRHLTTALVTTALAASLTAGLITLQEPQAQAQRAAEAAPINAEGEAQGLSRERLARIAPAMKAQVDAGIFPGAVTLIARRGEIVHYEAHGFLDLTYGALVR